MSVVGGFERKIDNINITLKRKVERGEFEELVNSLDKFALKMSLERLSDQVKLKADITDVDDLRDDLGMAKENMK